MDDFVSFVIENWKVLLIIFITIITFILQVLFKKAPVIRDDSAALNVCVYIEKAEKLFGDGHGEQKLQYVLDCLGDTEGEYKKLVEYILSLPKKKD